MSVASALATYRTFRFKPDGTHTDSDVAYCIDQATKKGSNLEVYAAATQAGDEKVLLEATPGGTVSRIIDAWKAARPEVRAALLAEAEAAAAIADSSD